jgi:tRNA(fMet)-specific endonuclease VapC
LSRRRVVVDTSVVSYLLKSHSLARQYRLLLEDRILGISFMTVAELYRWPLQRQWGERKISLLMEHLADYTVLPHDDVTSWEWAKIKSIKGHPISDSDAWIAATAICYGAPLVTHNSRHFLHIDGLRIITIDP